MILRVYYIQVVVEIWNQTGMTVDRIVIYGDG
jgi:hypothetical protein